MSERAWKTEIISLISCQCTKYTQSRESNRGHYQGISIHHSTNLEFLTASSLLLLSKGQTLLLLIIVLLLVLMLMAIVILQRETVVFCTTANDL